MQALRLRTVAAVAAGLIIVGCACGKARSPSERAAFVAAHQCPAPQGSRCPGYEVDHIVPLCAGGPDKPENMQWLSVEAHREKTREDVKNCRR